jgi:glutathione-regulated potassium-efflux system ancillary protein KefG
MSPRVATEELLDAQGVANVLDLSHRNTVSQYQRRYSDMPRPVVDLGEGRVKLWLRPEIERWAAQQAASGRTGRLRRRAGRGDDLVG